MNSKKKKVRQKKTFKVQSRINNSKSDQIDMVIIDEFIKEYESDVEKIRELKKKEEYIINESNKISRFIPSFDLKFSITFAFPPKKAKFDSSSCELFSFIIFFC